MDRLLQLKSSYILSDATIYNRVSKISFITNVFVLEYDSYIIMYDLKNDNIRLESNYIIQFNPDTVKQDVVNN